MKIRILLFDDIPKSRKNIKQGLENALGARGEVQEFKPGAGNVKKGVYEDRLIGDLKARPNMPVHMIVADRDLSGFTKENYGGLSETTVRYVATLLGMPECGYARGESATVKEFIKRGEQSEKCIRLTLKPSIDEFAKRVVEITDGFLSIAERLNALKGRDKLAHWELLATILEKPAYADKIALYSSGDRTHLAGTYHSVGENPKQKIQRLACSLGYWLWDSVLRYPGVTVGIIPASSYLNIREDIFMKDAEVQSLFSKARYHGPFAAAKVPMWWRGMLDDIVAKSGCEDGRAFVAKQLGREIPPSRCCEEPSSAAGYYCMLREKPVSLKNSKAGLQWFPRGADLARISTSAFEEWSPWL